MVTLGDIAEKREGGGAKNGPPVSRGLKNEAGFNYAGRDLCDLPREVWQAWEHAPEAMTRIYQPLSVTIRCGVTVPLNSETAIPTTIKGIIDSNHGRLQRQREWVLYCRSSRLDTIKSETKKMVASRCFFKNRTPLFRPESELSQSWSRSRCFQFGIGIA